MVVLFGILILASSRRSHSGSNPLDLSSGTCKNPNYSLFKVDDSSWKSLEESLSTMMKLWIFAILSHSVLATHCKPMLFLLWFFWILSSILVDRLFSQDRTTLLVSYDKLVISDNGTLLENLMPDAKPTCSLSRPMPIDLLSLSVTFPIEHPSGGLVFHFNNNQSGTYKIQNLVLKWNETDYCDFNLEGLGRENRFTFDKQRYVCSNVKLSQNETTIELSNLQFAIMTNETNFENLEMAVCEQDGGTFLTVILYIISCVLLIVLVFAIGNYLYMCYQNEEIEFDSGSSYSSRCSSLNWASVMKDKNR